MARDRDSQRQRVYDAERRAFGWWHAPADGLLSIEQCQAYVDKVLASKWLANQDDMKMQTNLIRRLGSVVVIAGRGGANAAINPRYGTTYGFLSRISTKPSIAVGVRARQPLILLHELSHLLQPSGTAAHGWEFCSVYLRLVRHFMGAEAHDKLKAEFKAGKVRFTKPRPKRQITPEQKAVLVERLAAARAKKMDPSLREAS